MTAANPRLFGSGPVLPVRDIVAAVEYYRDKLGFAVDFVMGTPPTHGSVVRDSVGIQFTRTREDFLGSDYPGWTYIFVENIDGLYEEVQQRGATITRPLENHNHGMREFQIADLNAFQLRFGQYIEA